MIELGAIFLASLAGAFSVGLWEAVAGYWTHRIAEIIAAWASEPRHVNSKKCGAD